MRKDTVEDTDDSESQEPTKKACDGCFRLKRACDKRQPCAQCKSRVVPCTYTREPKQKTVAGEKPVEAEPVSAESSSSRKQSQYQQATNPAIPDSLHGFKAAGYSMSASAPQQAEDDTITKYRSSIPETSHSIAPMSTGNTITSGSFQIEHPEMDSTLGFLAHVTSTSGIISTFECGTDQERWQILHDEDSIGYGVSRDLRTSSTSTAARSGRSYSSGNMFAPAGQNEQQYWLYGTEPSVSSHLGSPGMAGSQSFARAFSTSSSESGVGFPRLEQTSSFGATVPSHARGPWQNLHIACQKIVARMREAVSTANRSSVIEYSWSPEIERECTAFFSTINCRKFLRLFFAAWAPNAPIIHKPTFDPSQALESLVAVMVLLDKYLLLSERGNSSRCARACTSPDASHLEKARKWVSRFLYLPRGKELLCPVQESILSHHWLWPA